MSRLPVLAQVPYGVQLGLLLFGLCFVLGCGLRLGALAVDLVVLDMPAAVSRGLRRAWARRPGRCEYCRWPSWASGWRSGKPIQWSHRRCRVRACAAPAQESR